MKVILFDGVCKLCNGFVNFIIRFDREKIFRFSALQSSYSRELLESLGYDTEKKNTVYLYEDGLITEKSEAIFSIAEYIPFVSWLFVFSFLPKTLLDKLYDFIAKNRYKLFGKRTSCRIPEPHLLKRFL